MSFQTGVRLATLDAVKAFLSDTDNITLIRTVGGARNIYDELEGAREIEWSFKGVVIPPNYEYEETEVGLRKDTNLQVAWTAENEKPVLGDRVRVNGDLYRVDQYEPFILDGVVQIHSAYLIMITED